MSKGIEIFTPLADDYARYRPGYPAGVLDELARVCGLTAQWVVADIGSGTGNLARLFLDAGHQAMAVEPNREMREWAERRLSEYEAFVSLDGTAESIPIEADSVDLVAVGQALHWFDVDSARSEFRRILRPGGWVAVMWNDPVPNANAFTREYRALCGRFVSAQPAPISAPPLDTGVDRFFANTDPYRTDIRHTMRHDLQGLLGRARSSGHLQPGTPCHEEFVSLLTDLFARHQRDGLIEFHYITRLYASRLDSASVSHQ